VENAIEIDDLVCRFGETTAVDGLSLRVPRGTVFGFLGPNGAGKTTTIKTLVGLSRATSGRMRVLGYEVPGQTRAMRREVTLLLESPGVYDKLDALTNLEVFGEFYGMTPHDATARAKALLEKLGLASMMKRRVGKLSTGERRKLGIARTLLSKPKLVFLDEPTAGLDAEAAAALRDDIAQLVREDGLTVFLTTHHLEEVERLCDSVAVIRAGKLIAQGSPRELAARSSRPEVTVVATNVSDAAIDVVRALPGVASVARNDRGLIVAFSEEPNSAALNRALVGADADVSEIVRDHGGFERAFLDLVRETT